jgi:hypothetical protein
LESGSLGERIDTLREQADQQRSRAALWACVAIMSAAVDVMPLLHRPKSAVIYYVGQSLLTSVAGTATFKGVLSGLESMHTGQEAASLVPMQAQQEQG